MNNSVGKTRDISIDMAKGIGMIAVIIGHMTVPVKVTDFIFSFHMPLFFLINGYFFKEKSIKQCIWLKFKTLVIPYITTCILVIISSVFWNVLKGQNIAFIVAECKMWTLAALYGSGTYTHFLKWDFHIIGAIWFLLAMFWSDVIFNILLKIKGSYIWGLLLAAIGYLTTDIIWLPTSFQAGLTALLFIEIGHFAKKKNLLEKGINNGWVLLAAAAFWTNSIINGGHLYMVGNHYENGILDVLGAVSATLLIIKFARFSTKRFPRVTAPLVRYGKDSLIVLCFHLIELNTFPWYIITNRCSYAFSRIIIAALKISWSALAVILVKYIPVINMIFGKRKIVK